MKRIKMMALALLVGSATLAGCKAGPQTYTNEFITNHEARQQYKIAAIDSDGYVADQLVLAMKDKLPSMSPHEGAGDVHVRLSSRTVMMQASKKSMKPVITTVTLQVIRSSDQEVIYSLVKQYEIQISASRRGKVTITTAGWVDQAAGELAQSVAAAIGMEG